MPIILVRDTFTDANGTVLSAHTPDVNQGHPWVLTSPASYKIQGNQLISVPDFVIDVASIDGTAAGTTAQPATVGVDLVNLDSSNNVGMALRFVDTNNFILPFVSGGTYIVAKIQGGAFSVLLNTGFGSANGDRMECRLGDAVSVNNCEIFINGVSRGTWSDSLNAGSSLHGIFELQNPNAFVWDNFQISIPSPPATGLKHERRRR